MQAKVFLVSNRPQIPYYRFPAFDLRHHIGSLSEQTDMTLYCHHASINAVSRDRG